MYCSNCKVVFKYSMVSAVVLLLNGSAFSEIIFKNCKNVVSAPNFWYNNKVASDTNILAFNEMQDIYIGKGEIVSQFLNKWDDIKKLDTIKVVGGYISSHMVYFHKKTNTGRTAVEAEVEFADSIIGYLADDSLFAKSNMMYAPNPTHTKAPGANQWTLEEKSSWTELDSVAKLSKSRLYLKWSNKSATDPLRVFTIRFKTKITARSSQLPLAITDKPTLDQNYYLLSGRKITSARSQKTITSDAGRMVIRLFPDQLIGQGRR